MSERLDLLRQKVAQALEGLGVELLSVLNELTIDVSQVSYFEVCRRLQNIQGLEFDQLIDLCGVDFSTYGNQPRETKIFAVVLHLLSVGLNQRIRVRVYCEDNEFPLVDSVVSLWSSAAWYEREAFDLYGIVFEGHPDLRRILTDYGFVGYPFRKDFPVSGHVEMRYDPEQKRVVYQSVTIESREITPRVVREEQYGGAC